MKIQFLGAAKVVTGSNYLITTDQYKILLDCGLFQGSKQLESLNQEPFSFDPSQIDYLFLSHAHIDHSGRIPKLVKEGFKGKIICTKGTKDLCDLMLVDSGHIQESDTEWENNKRKRAGLPLIKPLYTAQDAKISLNYFQSLLYDQKVQINENIAVRFKDAGHILGSSIIELWITEKNKTAKIVFSGDLGMRNKPILKSPETIKDADYLILESTYANRLHEKVEKRTQQLVHIINQTALRQGTTIIPSFAVNRTQELIYELKQYYQYTEGLETFMKIPIYVDSPMAVHATKIYQNNSHGFDEATKKLILKGDDPFQFDNLYYITSQEESMRLNKEIYPKVIISASGMCSAGRVQHHLKHNLWKKENSIIFVGYQAEGTLGRQIKDGAKSVNVLGEKVQVSAKIHNIEGFSGHADQKDLMSWLRGFKKIPRKIFIVHGEEESAETFKDIIESTFATHAIVPNMGDTFEIKDHFLQTYSNERLQPIKKKENIIKELQQVYDVFDNLVHKTDQFLDDKLLKKDYDTLKNKLVELNRQLMDISMLLSK